MLTAAAPGRRDAEGRPRRRPRPGPGVPGAASPSTGSSDAVGRDARARDADSPSAWDAGAQPRNCSGRRAVVVDRALRAFTFDRRRCRRRRFRRRGRSMSSMTRVRPRRLARDAHRRTPPGHCGWSRARRADVGAAEAAAAAADARDCRRSADNRRSSRTRCASTLLQVSQKHFGPASPVQFGLAARRRHAILVPVVASSKTIDEVADVGAVGSGRQSNDVAPKATLDAVRVARICRRSGRPLHVPFFTSSSTVTSPSQRGHGCDDREPGVDLRQVSE